MFGRLLTVIDGWSYRVDNDVDPDDRTTKFVHCLVDPSGIHHFDFDSMCNPYEHASEDLIQDFVSYKEFQQCRANF